MKIQSVKRTYEDIINLPHPVSEKHSPMSRSNRAAQFAPFAALSGLGKRITEAALETEDQYKENTKPIFDDWSTFEEESESQELTFENNKEIYTNFLEE